MSKEGNNYKESRDKRRSHASPKASYHPPPIDLLGAYAVELELQLVNNSPKTIRERETKSLKRLKTFIHSSENEKIPLFQKILNFP